MHRRFVLFLLTLSLCLSGQGQGIDFLGTLSPKLRQFLADHAAASNLLMSSLSETFVGRKVQVYYFYSDDESVPKAYHYYASDSTVVITLRENQHPFDEFILLTFEILNSQSEKQFQRLVLKAQAGEISRTNFAMEMLKVEFGAVCNMRARLLDIKLRGKDIPETQYYKSFTEAPRQFEDFLAYSQRMSAHRNLVKEYEVKYDLLRKEIRSPPTGEQQLK